MQLNFVGYMIEKYISHRVLNFFNNFCIMSLLLFQRTALHYNNYDVIVTKIHFNTLGCYLYF